MTNDESKPDLSCLTAPIDEFLTTLKNALPKNGEGDARLGWLAIAADPADRDAFTLLSAHCACVVLEPEAGLDVDTLKRFHEAILRYPHRYVEGLERVLLPYRSAFEGVILGCDLAPWVRHLVYACKHSRLRTLLVPKRALREKRISNPWAGSFWSQPSGYVDPALTPVPVVDAPLTDAVFAFDDAECRALEALGYPPSRILRLHPTRSTARLHRGQGLFGIRPPDALYHLRTRHTLARLADHLRGLTSTPVHPFEPHGLEELFGGNVEPLPRAGLVAYHRAIDASTVHVPAMLGYRRLTVPSNIEEAQAADVFACWGGSQGEHRKQRLKRWAKRLNRQLLLVEDGLFRSIEIGLSGSPTVSILLDDCGAYYDATRSNRLEKLLASKLRLTGKERGRANRCIRRIVEYRLSKYNHAPDRPLPYPQNSVLVVDQRKGDLSVTLGLADESSFREMLLAACRENPESTILVKRHPDAMSGGKQSYYSNETLAELGHLPNVQLVDFETNPHALFDCCSKVYVVSSGMGFEALLRGLPVHCYGMPFYAGWGLTTDRLSVPRRKRKRRLSELFYAACILHSRYYDPVHQRPCTLETVIGYLKTARDEYHAKARTEPQGSR